MILGVALEAAEPGTQGSPPLGGGPAGLHIAALARAAEAAGLDFVTLGWAGKGHASIDALSLAAALVSQTRRIGLCAASPLPGWAPFNVARAFAAFDHLSLGRAAWMAEPNAEPAAWNQEFVEVVRELWDSWEDGAIVLDRERACFTDARRVRRINHRGAHFTVEGPLNAPRPPQGHPPIFAAGDDAALAAIADVVILAAPDVARRGGGARRVLVDLPARLDGPRDADALADRMEALFAEGACDGFHLRPARLPADLAAVTERLSPVLRARGLRSAGNHGTTLREHLGLPRPVMSFAEAAP